MLYKISSQFTDTPGGRYRSDGKFSGEEFREAVLQDIFRASVSNDEILTVDLDDTYGYPSSFLEESFGGLARVFGVDLVKKYIKIKSDDDPMQIDRINEYIENALDK